MCKKHPGDVFKGSSIAVEYLRGKIEEKPLKDRGVDLAREFTKGKVFFKRLHSIYLISIYLKCRD